MLKEIYEERDVLKKTIECLENEDFDLTKYRQIDIVACRSAYHVGLVSEHLFEKYADIQTNAHIASEFRYKKLFKEENRLIIVISQSGETADTLAALKLANEENIDTLAIVNVKESSIAREAKKVIYTAAGCEIAVATTKAYLSQLATLSFVALKTSLKKNKISKKQYGNYKQGYEEAYIEIQRLTHLDYLPICLKIFKKEDLFYIGRGIDYALSIEGNLKLKEISYIHSETYPGGELKHGTISLIEKDTPVISVITDEKLKEKTVSN